MLVKISPRAAKQIKEIYDYYFLFETPLKANKVLSSFYSTFENTSKNPYLFAKAKSVSNSNFIRQGVIHRTFVFRYHIYQSHIRIVSIIHGKRIV